MLKLFSTSNFVFWPINNGVEYLIDVLNIILKLPYNINIRLFWHILNKRISHYDAHCFYNNISLFRRCSHICNIYDLRTRESKFISNQNTVIRIRIFFVPVVVKWKKSCSVRLPYYLYKKNFVFSHSEINIMSCAINV